MYECLFELLTAAGPHRSQWTHSPNLVALVSDSLGNGCQADLAFTQALQNLGFKSLSTSIPVIKPLVMANLTAE